MRPATNAKQEKRIVGPAQTKAQPDGMTRKQRRGRISPADRTDRPDAGGEGTPHVPDSLAREYQAMLRHKSRKRSTLTAVESAVRVHLLPSFQGKSIDAISFDDVTDFVATLDGNGLSPKSVRNYVGTLSAMLAWAAAAPRFCIPRNPCEGVELPDREDREEIRFLDDAETDTILRNGRSARTRRLTARARVRRGTPTRGTLRVAHHGPGLVREPHPRPTELGAGRIRHAQIPPFHA
jgi:hypothetical protein